MIRRVVPVAVATVTLVALLALPGGAVDMTSPGSPQGNVTPTLQPTTAGSR